MTKPPAGIRTLVVERELPHPPERVWRALTQGALLEEWLMRNDFRAVVGHAFQFRTDPMPHWDGVVDGRVLEVEPPVRLAYTWNAAGGLATVITWTLTPTKDGVLVRLEQAGFRPEDEANYRGAAYGWERYLGGLERVAARLAG